MARPICVLSTLIALVIAPGASSAQGEPRPVDTSPETLADIDTAASPEAAHEPAPDLPRLDLDLDLDEVEYGTTIVGRPRPLPATATTREIDADILAMASRRSAEELLHLVPGLHLSAHGGAGKAPQMFWRGFDAVHGADVEVRVAGMRINELSNVHGQGYVDIGFVIPEVVWKMTGSRGSFDLAQGNFATAGSIGMELGVPPALRGQRLLYEAGTTGRHRVLGVIAPRDMHLGTFAAVEAAHDSGHGVNRGSQRAAALAQTHQELGRADRWIEVFAGAAAARFGEPAPLPLADYEAGRVGWHDTYSDDTEGQSSRILAGLRVRDHGGRQRVEVMAHAGWRHLALEEDFTGFLLHPEMGDRRLQVHESTSGSASIAWEREVAPGVTLLAGTGGMVEAIEQREDQITAEGAAWQHNLDLSALQLAGDAHLGARAELGDAVVIQGGARVDVFHFDVDHALAPAHRSRALLFAISPRIRASWRVSEDWALFGACGRGLRAPEARSVIEPPPDGDGGAPRISTSDAAELGARWRPGPRVQLGAGLFATVLQSEMAFDHVSGVSVALDRSRRVGVDADVQYAPVAWVRLRADVSAVDARFVASGLPVPAAPRFLTTAEAWIVSPSAHEWRAGAQLRYLAPRPLAHGSQASAVAVLDLAAEYRRGPWQIAVQIDNALGTRWREGEYHFASWFDRSQPRSQIPRLHYAAGRPLGARVALTGWF